MVKVRTGTGKLVGELSFRRAPAPTSPRANDQPEARHDVKAHQDPAPGDGGKAHNNLMENAKGRLNALRPFIIIRRGSAVLPRVNHARPPRPDSMDPPSPRCSLAYILFTMTDGAVRMIVLLHAFEHNFSAFEVALMFTLYELAGVFTNVLAGVMGAK